MRLFIAMDIEPQVRDRIEQIQRQLKQSLNLPGKAIRWVRPEQVHLTLKFLGEVPDHKLAQVCNAMTRTAAEHKGFNLRIQGLGVFGRPARIIWAGCQPCPGLMTLQSALEDEFETIGWAKESHPFAGHLTICRVKTTAVGQKIAAAVDRWRNETFGTVRTRQVVLYESRAAPNGPRYQRLHTAALKQSE